jgi:hypothetical protein
LEKLESQKGKQFDPDVVDALARFATQNLVWFWTKINYSGKRLKTEGWRQKHNNVAIYISITSLAIN